MATLAAQILTDWQAGRSSVQQIGASNPDDDDTSADTTYLTSHAGKAATMVKRYLGSVDGDDEEAVEIGIECMDYKLAVAAKGHTPELVALKRELEQTLRELAEARVDEESDAYVLNPDDVDDDED